MKKNKKGFIDGDIIIAIIGILLVIFEITQYYEGYVVPKSAEYGYFSGQQDAIEGDIRIDLETCQWIKSPWDDNSHETKININYCKK